MGACCRHLTVENRNSRGRGLNEGLSCRGIAERLGRCASTVSREVSRNRVGGSYEARGAGECARGRRRRGRRKLVRGTALLREVHMGVLGGWSPQQIAGRLKQMGPDEPSEWVSRETSYTPR